MFVNVDQRIWEKHLRAKKLLRPRSGLGFVVMKLGDQIGVTKNRWYRCYLTISVIGEANEIFFAMDLEIFILRTPM